MGHCRDPAVQALQFLESLNSKDTNQKAQFFRNTLLEVFSIIPRVNLNNKKLTIFLIIYSQKLWLQQIWPFLQEELTKQEVNFCN